jgi:osmotically inducible lipoprotein OsmB
VLTNGSAVGTIGGAALGGVIGNVVTDDNHHHR